ncbi:D-amino-acid dehydrogenase [Mycoplana sp. BE70]|uniref:NAD(P)/FAD-dependent oxidoreductase n=1 Tax=Mycoplana sp. BE70 TaxID=2817775 RepID=UPI00286491C7|nr:FAD-binding oxidoreductase [Mycoplana sp. BE70]MDR6759398.1 D-amino-acid dehydrogenase [Mycoplana sp. BE70]
MAWTKPFLYEFILLTVWFYGGAALRLKPLMVDFIPTQNSQIRGTSHSVAVIGAGIVGASSAVFLQAAGHKVTLWDPRGPAGGASYGNAGIVEASSCLPIATPGILREIPSMLLDKNGPVIIRPSYFPAALPWLMRLVLATRWSKIETTARALLSLSQNALKAYDSLLDIVPARDVIHDVGRLSVYSTEAGFAAGAASRRFATDHGMSLDILDEAAIHDIEPHLAPIFCKGVLQPHSRFVSNPKRLVDACVAHVLAQGGAFRPSAVVRIESRERGCAIVTDAGTFPFDKIVVASGAWSEPLCQSLGFSVPLESERGYHLLLPQPAQTLRRPTVWAERYINLCPMEEGLRMTVGVEYAGRDAPPDYGRAHRLLAHARTMLPSLAGEPQSEWLGLRPSLPDSLPVLGPAPGHPNVILAFGHNHIGLTLGPATGQVVADLVSGQIPAPDLAPFSPKRSYVR